MVVTHWVKLEHECAALNIDTVCNRIVDARNG